ncbi:SLC13 family permease [Dyella sp.]|uniref:SLC13 family permease n=1 Tax=Dyella sp. TaxID=1869338 RepID=UPI002ED001F7
MSRLESLYQRLKHEWLLLLFALLAVVLAIADPHGWRDYQRWLRLPTLAGLFGLMLAIQGIRDSGWVQRIAVSLVSRMHSLRGLGLLLVTSTALLSTVLTNDVSLFLLVPLTVAIGAMTNLPVLRMVILEALAVNAGSTISPIGNPQNLLLWQYQHLPLLTFVRVMLPAAAVMFALVALLTWFWLPRARIELDNERLDHPQASMQLGLLSLVALSMMVLMMENGQALLGAGLVIVPFLIERGPLRRLDWLLLATFAAIFLSLGHLAELPLVQNALSHLDLDRPLNLYLAGILASQVISNVPATVLLLDHASDAMALAVAVNVGGFGLVIGSLANLIALRLARQPGSMALFHRVSVPFLLVCGPAVYGVWMVMHR